MGATLPVIAQHWSRRGSTSLVGGIGFLYGINTLGAVVGVIVTGEFDLTTLDSNNPRGLCAVCGVAGKGISVSNGARTYLVTFNAVGRWKRTLQ